MSTIKFDVPAKGGSRRQFDVAVVGGERQQMVSTGVTFYVDAAKGTDANSGTDSSFPLLTIAQALSLAVSGRGDIIALMPGTYAENVVVTKDDISIVAVLGSTPGVTFFHRPVIGGLAGPALTLRQTRRFRASGLYLYSTGAVAVLTDGEASSFDNCEIDADGGAGVKFLSATDPAFTGSGTAFVECIFDGSVNGIKVFASTAPDSTGQATNCVVKNCQFYGNSGADIADDGAGDGNYFDSWKIEGCTFQDVDKAVFLAMKGAGAAVSSKVVIACNYFASRTGALDTTMCALPTGSAFVGNYDARGIVDGHTF